MLSGKVSVVATLNRDRSMTYRLSWWEKANGSPRRNLTKRLWRTKTALTLDERDEWVAKAQHEALAYTEELTMIDQVKTAAEPHYRKVRGETYRSALPYAVRDYLEEVEMRPGSPSWKAQQERVVRSFLAYLGEHHGNVRRASSLCFEHVNGWRAWRQGIGGGVKDSTLLVECSALQPFLDWLKDTRRLKFPVLAITKGQRRYLHRDRSAPNIPETARVAEIVNHQPDQIRRLSFATLALCGLRSGELKGLRVRDYGAGVLQVPKNGRETTKRHARDLPTGPWLTGELERLQWQRHRTADDDAPLFASANDKPLTRQLNTWLTTWGHTPHDLRRWFSNTLLGLDCPDPIRCALMAHALGGRDGAYYIPTLEDKRRWMLRLDDLLSGQLVLLTPSRKD